MGADAAFEWVSFLEKGGGYALAVCLAAVVVWGGKKYAQRQLDFDSERRAMAAAYEQKLEGTRSEVIAILKTQTELAVLQNAAMEANTAALTKVREALVQSGVRNG